MYLTVRQQVKQLNKKEYKSLRELSHVAKNLANQAIYNIRQHYFENSQYLRYEENYNLLKDSPNYKLLNSNMAQQILREVDGAFKSFFGLLKLSKKGGYQKAVRLPNYLPKDGHTTIIIAMVRINGNKLTIPYSYEYKKTHDKITITVPPKVVGKNVKEIRIIPKSKARYFEIQYTYEVEEIQSDVDKNKALGIDLGVNNFATCVTSEGKSFIVDGRRLKSINQWYNKENARLQSVKDKQGNKRRYTNRQVINLRKRNNKINDYMLKSARLIINYCLQHKIGTVVLGYNTSVQVNSNMGKKNNQSFVQIPFGRFKNKLEYLCKLYGIDFREQEESYTSKTSFFDNDEIPVYDKQTQGTHKFSGKRVKRGLYKTNTGYTFNADVNGALNILRKSKAVDMNILCSRGELDMPIRIRVA